jgi:hypothetical protein
MKGKLLAFPFISFAESGLFNGLWRIQIKKSPHAELASRVVLHSRSQTPYLCPLLRLTLRAIFRWRENVITHFYLCKDNAGPCCVSCRGTGTRSLGEDRGGKRRRRQALGAQPQGADQQRTRTRTQCRNAYRDRPVSVFQASARVVAKIGLLPPIRA